MTSTAGAQRPEQGLGRYRGARYTRTWLTTLTGMPLLSLIAFSILGGDGLWVVLVPLTLLIFGALWLIPLSVITSDGIRIVLRATFVPWSEVARVLDPRPGDEQARIELTDGHILRLPGVSPAAVPALRALRAGRS